MRAIVFLPALAVAAGALSSAEIIDRIAVIVDRQAITQSQLLQDVRITEMLNGKPLDLEPAARREAARRLVEQALIGREMELASYPQPPESKVDELLKRVKQARFPSPMEYEAALREYDITEADLKRYLRRQAQTLEFIDYRFRPEVLVTEAEVRACYEKRVTPLYEKQNARVPSYEEVRAQCEESVTAERVNGLVDAWLKEARARANIVYEEDAFR